jgi:predicted XRE-type DNA-binding protein
MYQALSALAWYRNTPITYLKFVLELAGDVLVASEAMPDRNHRLIADTLAWLRANRVKQKELAESLGVTPQHVNDILGGRTHFDRRARTFSLQRWSARSSAVFS